MSFFWPQNIKLENYGGFKKLLLLGLGVNNSHDCKPLKKSPWKCPRVRAKMHPLTVLEWFSCWTGVWLAGLRWSEHVPPSELRTQSDYRVHMEYKNRMWRCQLSEQPSCLVVQPEGKLSWTKNVLTAADIKFTISELQNTHKVLDWELTKSKDTALDTIILPTSHFSCPLLRGVNRADLKSQAFFKVFQKKKKGSNQ